MAHNPRLLIGGGMALSAIFAVLAAVSLTSSAWSLLADDVADRIRAGETATNSELLDAVHTEIAASAVFDSGRHLADAVVTLSALKEQQPENSAIGTPDLEATITRAVEAAPASPYNWARLAAVRYAKGNIEGAAIAYQQSLKTGEYAPGLGASRAWLGFLLVRDGKRQFAVSLARQVRFAAVSNVNQLANFTRDIGFEAYCHAILSNDPLVHGAYVNALQQVSRVK